MSIRIMTWVFDHSPYEGKAQMIHLALADHANDEGYCWPGSERVAIKARATVEYVRRTLKDMEERGFIETGETGGGRGKTKHLRLLGPWSETPNSVGGADEKPPTLSGETPNSEQTPTSYRNHYEPSHASARAEDSSFGAFWSLYPLKKDKGHARTAYAKALKTATATEIADGLDRCLPELQKDLRYTPHAATWLNGERWTDEAPTKATSRHWSEELADQWA